MPPAKICSCCVCLFFVLIFFFVIYVTPKIKYLEENLVYVRFFDARRGDELPAPKVNEERRQHELKQRAQTQ